MITDKEFSDENNAFGVDIEKNSQETLKQVVTSIPASFESERSDSGMEEESFVQESAENTDEETEIVGHRRSKGKKRMIIDDDDEEEEEDNDNDPNDEKEESHSDLHTECNTATEEKQASSDLDDDVENAKNNSQKSPDPPIQSDDEGEEDGDGSFQLKFNDKDVFDAESSDEEQPRSLQKDPIDESLSDNQENGNIKSDEEKEEDEDMENNEVNDEGFDEDDVDPEILEKLKKLKGASKSAKDREKYARKAKPTADKMLELYSESQRLTRDSRVNLPYYEPEEKSLDDFLARASKKKQEYSALKRANDYQKAQIIHEKLAVTPPKPTPSRRSSRKSERQTTSTQEVMSTQPSSSTNGVTLHDSGLMSQESTQSEQASQSSTVVLQSSFDTDQCPNLNGDEEDADELPDLVGKSTLSERCTSLAKISASENPNTSLNVADTNMICIDKNESETQDSHHNMDVKCANDQVGVEGQNGNACVEEHNTVDTVPALQKDPSRDLFSSQCVAVQDSQSYNNENPETALKLGSGQLADAPDLSSIVTVVNETPLSTQSTQLSALSVNTTSGQLEMNVSTSGAQSETHVNVSDGDTKCDNESSASANALQDTDIANASQSDLTLVTEKENCVTPSSHKKSIIDKLQLQGLSLPPAPKLLGTPNDVICLDEPDNLKKTPKDPGLLKLMDRLARHSQKKVPKQAYDVDISIIEKENVQGQQELKLKSVKYHVQPEEQLIASDGAPGSCRLKLNQFLKVGMRKKREDGRRKRMEQYQLDNEEGFEKAEEDQEEEEEEEMTDDEDEYSDDDDDEEEAELGDYGAGSDDDGEDYNPLLDTEAKEDDDDDEEENEALSNFNEDSNDFHLNFEVSDEENEVDDEGKENEKADEEELISVKKKKRRSAAVLSDEDDDEEKEEMKKKMKDKHAVFDEDQATSQSLWSNDMMTPLSRHLEDTQPQGQTKFRRQSSCSPDLYATANVAEEYESSPGPNSHNDSYSQSCDYAHSQMLDADGYLKVTQTQKPPKSRISLLAQSPSKDIGAFGSSMSIGQIFGGATSQAKPNFQDDGDEDDNMKELMGLCSGKFPKANDDDDEDSLPSSQARLKRTQSFEARNLFDDGDEDDAYDPFRILSQDENAQDFQSLKKKPVLSDSENEEDKENDNLGEAYSDDDSENEEVEDVPKFIGFKDKKRGIRREFLEEEAELSGSEFDSDENLDLAEEDDILEEEEGDRDVAGISESKLRDQVGRLHMKQLQDDDDREIMRYKEMYLQDGDLYTDGRGRRRNFRWKDMDNNSQQDMFTNESDDEHVEEDPEEIQWRKDRYEREKFLEESANKGSNEDSQLVKLGQGFLQKKDSFGMSQDFLPPPKENPKKKVQPPKKGSFLTRSKDALIKMAKIAKSALGGNVKNGRGFIFQSVDEKETPQEPSVSERSMQPPKRKAHVSSQQAAKKPKLSHNSTTQPIHEKPAVKRKNSILHLLG